MSGVDDDQDKDESSDKYKGADRLRVAVIGCGNIAGPYVDDLKRYSEIELVGVADVDTAKAATFGKDHEVTVLESVDALIADSSIDLAVNLTSHHAHLEVSTRCLNAGKNVYSEKPLATTYAGAQSLVALAREKGLRLGCSPFTLTGEAQQTAWKWIRAGKLGTVRVVYAEVNWARIETWHPTPQTFYEVGPLYDVGVYPLTILTAIFGPAISVTAYGKVVMPDRITNDDVPFKITTPDFVVTMIEHENGTVTRLTTNFYVGHHNKQTGIEFHGDQGSLYLASWLAFNSPVEYADFGKSYEMIDLVKEGQKGIAWGSGVLEMTHAMLAGKPHRCTGEQAAHVTEILEAAARSMQSGGAIKVESKFQSPAPMSWAV